MSVVVDLRATATDHRHPTTADLEGRQSEAQVLDSVLLFIRRCRLNVNEKINQSKLNIKCIFVHKSRYFRKKKNA